MLLRGLSPVVAATAASQDVQQPPVGRAVIASGSFLSVLLLLWLLSLWTPSLYRVLLEYASVASLLEYVPRLDRSDAAASQFQSARLAAL